MKMDDVELVYTITFIEAVLREKREWAESLFGTRGIPIIERARDKLDKQLAELRK